MAALHLGVLDVAQAVEDRVPVVKEQVERVPREVRVQHATGAPGVAVPAAVAVRRKVGSRDGHADHHRLRGADDVGTHQALRHQQASRAADALDLVGDQERARLVAHCPCAGEEVGVARYVAALALERLGQERREEVLGHAALFVHHALELAWRLEDLFDAPPVDTVAQDVVRGVVWDVRHVPGLRIGEAVCTLAPGHGERAECASVEGAFAADGHERVVAEDRVVS